MDSSKLKKGSINKNYHNKQIYVHIIIKIQVTHKNIQGFYT